MENLPVIQATLLKEWLQLTSSDLLCVAALIIGAWLFTASMYSIIIAGLKKKYIASETARITAESNLNNVQQQCQQAQIELAEIKEQLGQQQKTAEAEKQRALNAEQQLTQRNQQLLAIIQRLASGFDIGEAPLQLIKDIRAEDVWQQHDKIITKLLDTLRTEQLAKTELQKFYQAEKDKVTETETRLRNLQTNLDSQTSLVSTLQIQNTNLQQQQNAAQQALAEATQKLTGLTQLEQRIPELEQQILQLTGKNALTVKPIETTVAPVQIAATVTTAPPDSAEKLKNLFKKPQQQPSHEPAIILPQETAQAEAIVTDILVTAINDEPDEPIATETTGEDSTEQTQESSLLKSWYRNVTGKKSDVTESEPELTPTPQIASPEPVEESSEKTSNVSALKGFYQKFTAKTEDEPELVAESIAVEETPEKASGSKLKGFYQKFTTKSEVKPEPVIAEPIAAEETPEKTNDSSSLKGLYQKFTTKEVEPEAEPKPAPVTETPEKINSRKGFSQRFNKPKETKLSDNEPSSRVEDVADKITDTVEGVKNLYGKIFSKNK